MDFPNKAPAKMPKSLPDLLASYERVIVIQAMQGASGSRERAAASLGISRVYLWKRMKALQIDLTLFPRAKSGRKKNNPA